MNTQLVAVVISEGFKLVGQIYRNRPIQLKTAPRELKASVPEKVPELRPEDFEAYKPIEIPEEDSVNAEGKATEIATGCVPCAIGHLGTCSGVLKESHRFALRDGLKSNDVIDRVGICLDELNALERVDLQPQMLVQLPEWERVLAQEALQASRDIRHALEAYNSVKTLEQMSAKATNLRTQIFRKWIKGKMEHLTPEEQVKIQRRVIKKLDELVPPEEEEENDQS